MDGEKELALKGHDEEIYPHLTWSRKVVEIRSDTDRVTGPWSDIRVTPEGNHPVYNRRPQWIPFTRKDVQDFISQGLPEVWRRWSVRWVGRSQASDVIYNDGFRAVFIFRTIEFMVRPVKEDAGPWRLHLTASDVINCLRAALWEDRGEQMSTVIGTASAPDSDEVKGDPRPRVSLEWRIDRVTEDRVSREVNSWRRRQFHPTDSKVYKQAKKAYDKQLSAEKKRQKELSRRCPAGTEGELAFVPNNPSSQPGQGMPPPRKRKPDSPSSPGPSYKRRSMGSESSTFSSSQSATSSPDLSRSSLFASSGSMHQQHPRLPSLSGMLSGERPGTGYSSGSSYEGTPFGSPGSTSSGDSQSTITSVTRGVSNMGIMSQGGYGGQPRFPLPNDRPTLAPIQTFRPPPAPGPTGLYERFSTGAQQRGGYGGSPSNQPGYGQGSQAMHPPPVPLQGYHPQGMPPPPLPLQGYPPQGMPPGQYYQRPPANPQGEGHAPYQPYQGSSASSESGWSDSVPEDPRGSHHQRGRHHHSSHGSHHHGGRHHRG